MGTLGYGVSHLTSYLFLAGFHRAVVLCYLMFSLRIVRVIRFQGERYKLRGNTTIRSVYREECGHLSTAARVISRYDEWGCAWKSNSQVNAMKHGGRMISPYLSRRRR
jgi:hypothetical protein